MEVPCFRQKLLNSAHTTTEKQPKRIHLLLHLQMTNSLPQQMPLWHMNLCHVSQVFVGSAVIPAAVFREKKRKNEVGEEETNYVSGPLEVNGHVRARAFMQFSDIRLKTNIADLVDALEIVSKLQGKTYEWKDGVFADEAGGRKVIGLIAQEVQKILPEVCKSGGYFS